MQHVYFDHNATTPVAPEVLRDLTATLTEVCGNASSIHYFGQAAKQRLEAARREIAARIGSNEKEIVFTSGGTESERSWSSWTGPPPLRVIVAGMQQPAWGQAPRRRVTEGATPILRR